MSSSSSSCWYNQQTIDKAIDALYQYLDNQKESESDNLTLWDEQQDINLVIEPKVTCYKPSTFNSIRIPLKHSFRLNGDNDICIITRSRDITKWKEILLTKYKINGVRKIMSYKEFEKDYKTQESRIQLSELYDLFIINPAIIYKVLSKLVPFLRNRNKSCAILPISYDLLQIKTTKYQLKLAKLIAKYRDSTYYMNFNLKHKFIKIGESKMDKDKLKENLINVLNYGLSILPNGGRKNVLRLSLHLNNTNIQLPFYVNIEPLDYNYDIIPSSITTKHSTHSNGIYLKKRKQIKLKAALKKNCNKKLKLALINNNNNNLSIANLTTLKYVKQCNV